MNKTHRKTYRFYEEGERELVYEDLLNEQGQIVSYKDYQAHGQAEGFSAYDQEGRLICEKEVVDGVIGSMTEFSYDKKGNLLSRKLFVADELFEEILYENHDHGHSKRVYQFGEEIERYTETIEGDLIVKEFFEGSELIERHKNHYDPEIRTSKIEITDCGNKLLAVRVQQFDEGENLLRYEEKGERGNLLALSEYEYQNGHLIFENNEDYMKDQYYQVSYDYDNYGNLTSKEIRTPSGKLMEYQKCQYDEQHRLILESGYSVGSFNAIYGTHVVGENYVFEHEYFEKEMVANS